jgi:hypothetical protein
MSSNRSADASMNGYFYQRYCCVLNILENPQIKYILEEGFEDIDLIKQNGHRDVIQIKYLSQDNTSDSSITLNSGLYKVIKSINNIQHNNIIDNIIYRVYNSSGNHINETIKSHFYNHNYINLGRYIILITADKIELELDINNINEAETIFDTNINKINEYFASEKGTKNKYIYDFLVNNNNCVSYLSKFKFEISYSYNELKLKIDDKICELYSSFINSSDDIYKNIKINAIKSTILNILSDKMFNNKDISTRIIDYSLVSNEINKIINALTNPENIYDELLKQNAKLISSYFDKNNNFNNLDILLNELYIIEHNSLTFKNISFYLELLKKYNTKDTFINSIIIKHKINYILEFLVNKIHEKPQLITNDDNTKIFTYLYILRTITKKTRNIPEPSQIFSIFSLGTTIKYF